MKRRRLAKKGQLFVVSAPSGCGKTTICRKLTSIIPRLTNSISVTTRPPRDNEASGRDYYFVSKSEFLKRRGRGEFLEWARNFGYLYGTPHRFVEHLLRDGKDVLLAIDVKGAGKVKKIIPKSIRIFLMPPSMSALKKRLEKRGTDTKAEIRKRLNIARREMTQARAYDYVVINDSINKVLCRLKYIIQSERQGLKNKGR